MDALPPCTAALAAQNKGKAVLEVALGLWLLAFMAVLLRFISRHLAKAKYGWDDWMIVLSLALSAAGSLMCIPLYNHWFGRHLSCHPDAIRFWMKTMFALQFLYTAILVTVKYSILLFLRRLFPVKSFKLPFWIMWTFVTLWGVEVIFTACLGCRPLRAFWGDGPGKCIDSTVFFAANAIPNIVTDVALLVLPIPWIVRLQLPGLMRASLIGIFACGISVISISSYRLYEVLLYTNSRDSTYNDTFALILSIVEYNVAIVSACLPSLGPLARKVFRFCGNGHPGSRPQTFESGNQRQVGTYQRGLGASNFTLAGSVEDEDLKVIRSHRTYSVHETLASDLEIGPTYYAEVVSSPYSRD